LREALEELDKCILPIYTIQDGKHHLCFNLNEEFFVQHPIDEIQSLTVSANVFFERRGTLIKGYVELEGKGQMECDICLDLCDVAFESEADFSIFIGGTRTETDTLDTEYYVEAEADNCDITDLVLDSIVLGLPTKRDHGTDKSGKYLCNNDVADLVGKYIVKNDENTDPRWDGLMNLKFN
jgi:uncharacterized metal-binding protein YceD (DUF177 family)